MSEERQERNVRAERLTFDAVLRDFVDEFVSTDRGFMHTLLGMVREPGRTVRRWIEDRDPRLTRPARFLMIVLAPLILLVSFTEWGAAQYAEIERALPPEVAAEGAVLEFVLRWQLVLYLVFLPVLALGTRLAFRRSGLTLPEHFVFNTYVYAVTCLACMPIIVATLGDSAPWKTALYWTFVAASVGYFAWACRDLFGRTIGVAVKALAVFLGAYLVYSVLAFAAIGLAIGYQAARTNAGG
jgi:hypothetical protein